MTRNAEHGIGVTEENFGDLLIKSLREARAISKGELEPVRRVRRTVTARESTVDPPPRYVADAVARIRKRMGLSQPMFAQVLNASPETVKAWEQGKRVPDGMALALLDVAERSPEVLLTRVQQKHSPSRGVVAG
jgi:putative transcriptional regulator